MNENIVVSYANSYNEDIISILNKYNKNIDEIKICKIKIGEVEYILPYASFSYYPDRLFAMSLTSIDFEYLDKLINDVIEIKDISIFINANNYKLTVRLIDYIVDELETSGTSNIKLNIGI